jgi:hypothetical protein
MKIACIGWGSLLWKPGPLPLISAWMPDGPLLPLEFARVGDGGELAIVLCKDGLPTPTWWACLNLSEIAAARELLRQREQIAPEHPEWVGSAIAHEGGEGDCMGIVQWLRQHCLDAAVWTALPPRFGGQEGRKPDAEEAVRYLAGLEGPIREHARSYVCQVPSNIYTPYRHAIAQRLGWVAQEGGHHKDAAH